MKPVRDDDVLLMWFDKLVEAQRNYLEIAKGIICVGTLDDTIHIGQSNYNDFKRLSELLNGEICRDGKWGADSEYVGYYFKHDEFKVMCLVDNPDYKKEVKSDD